MRIGIAQIQIMHGDIESNKEVCNMFFESAKQEQVDLLVFPEMTLTGFDVKNPALPDFEDISRRYFEEMSRQYQIAVIFGYSGKGKMKYRNHLSMLDAGKEVMHYEKIHPFSMGAEALYYEGGDRVTTTIFRGMTVAGMVCYDLRFPEIFQEASKTCQVIVVIANWPSVRAVQWQTLLKARAIENLCYVVGVNITEMFGKVSYPGLSAVYGPDGTCIAGEQAAEGLIVADIDRKTVDDSRDGFPCKKDRRTEIYREFYQ